jgi:hypothetical protein
MGMNVGLKFYTGTVVDVIFYPTQFFGESSFRSTRQVAVPIHEAANYPSLPRLKKMFHSIPFPTCVEPAFPVRPRPPLQQCRPAFLVYQPRHLSLPHATLLSAGLRDPQR